VNKTNTNNKEQKMIRTLPGCGHMGIIRGEPPSWPRRTNHGRKRSLTRPARPALRTAQ